MRVGRFIPRRTAALQPIVSVQGQRTIAYEALMRSTEPSLPHPAAVLETAERLGRVHDVGRAVRALATEAVARLPEPIRLFVNLPPLDLLDPELAAGSSPRHACST